MKEVDKREVYDMSEQVIEFREGSPLINGSFVEYNEKHVTTDKQEAREQRGIIEKVQGIGKSII